MKTLFLFLALSGALAAQTVQVAPDCFFFVTYTVASGAVTTVNGLATSNGRWPQAGYNNGNNGCVAWTVTYYDSNSAALTGLSLELDSAPDNAGAAGSWVSFSGTLVAGVNPNTSTTQAFTTMSGYNKWVSVNLTGLTGSGTVQVYAYGCRTLTCAAVVTAAAGGTSVSITSPLTGGQLSTFLGCPSSAEVALSGTGYTTIVTGSGSKVVYVCKLFVTSASAGSPVVNTITVGVGACGGSPTELLNAAGVTGIDEDFGGALRTGAGGSVCVKESTANSDKVTITYLQQ